MGVTNLYPCFTHLLNSSSVMNHRITSDYQANVARSTYVRVCHEYQAILALGLVYRVRIVLSRQLVGQTKVGDRVGCLFLAKGRCVGSSLGAAERPVYGRRP
jgi:hypothetical protein